MKNRVISTKSSKPDLISGQKFPHFLTNSDYWHQTKTDSWVSPMKLIFRYAFISIRKFVKFCLYEL